jgi:class 3 adenylate cyclase
MPRRVRCALALGNASKQIGLPLRAGLHLGEIEIRGRDIAGIAVHAAARVMSQSQSNEVLVSRVVTDLVAGAGLRFIDRGRMNSHASRAGEICSLRARSARRLLAQNGPDACGR